MYTPVEKGFCTTDVSEYIEVKMIFAEVLSRFTPAEDPFLFYFRSHFVPLFGLYQTVQRRIQGQTVANHTEATALLWSLRLRVDLGTQQQTHT